MTVPDPITQPTALVCDQCVRADRQGDGRG
jgi:hypothetical protein